LKALSDFMKSDKFKFDPSALAPESLKDYAGAGAEEVSGLPRRFLYPGQIFVAREATAISTILGSCAAVCLWDSRIRAGGMNHYLLPEGPEGPNRLRYGNIANPALLEELLALGCQSKHLEAKIFGGASAFSSDPTVTVGMKNIELAERFLREAGIRVAAKDVSGRRGRRLTFHTSDGSCVLKSYEAGS
jgi:chemotaxis protein CheD